MPLWHASAALQIRDPLGRLRPKPLTHLTRRERQAVELALTRALEGVGDHTQVHEEQEERLGGQEVALQRRHPMTPEEAAGVEPTRRLRRLGLSTA
jgi:hypothetical protein